MIANTKKDVTRANLLDHGSIMTYSFISGRSNTRDFQRVEIIDGEYTLISEGWRKAAPAHRTFDTLAALKKYITINHYAG